MKEKKIKKLIKRLLFYFHFFLLLFAISKPVLSNPPPLEIGPAENIPDVAVRVYNWLVRIAGILALLMLVWGGVEYAFFSTANPGKIEDAKDRIRQAIIGLIIALGSWLFLNFINPLLVNPPRP